MAKTDTLKNDTQSILERLHARREQRAADYGDYVVVHDLITLRDPYDIQDPLRPNDWAPVQLARGQTLPEGTFQRDLEHHLRLGSIAHAGSAEAKLALSGIRPTGAPVGAQPLFGGAFGSTGITEPEAVRAAQSAVPFGASPQDAIAGLMKLDLPSLVTVARAFGRPVAGDLKDLSKLDVAKQIVGDYEGAENEADMLRRRGERDQRVLDATETHGNPPYVSHDDETREETTGRGGSTEEAHLDLSDEENAERGGGETGSGAPGRESATDSSANRTVGEPPTDAQRRGRSGARRGPGGGRKTSSGRKSPS